jgi:uncharacterized Zn finger protein
MGKKDCANCDGIGEVMQKYFDFDAHGEKAWWIQLRCRKCGSVWTIPAATEEIEDGRAD